MKTSLRTACGTLAEKPRESSATRPKARGRPFVKGVCPNPGGRPKGSVSLKAALKRVLSRQDGEAMMRKLVMMGKAGDLRALKLLAELLGELGPGVALKLEQADNTPREIQIYWPNERDAARPADDRVAASPVESAHAQLDPASAWNGGNRWPQALTTGQH